MYNVSFHFLPIAIVTYQLLVFFVYSMNLFASAEFNPCQRHQYTLTVKHTEKYFLNKMK